MKDTPFISFKTTSEIDMKTLNLSEVCSVSGGYVYVSPMVAYNIYTFVNDTSDAVSEMVEVLETVFK